VTASELAIDKKKDTSTAHELSYAYDSWERWREQDTIGLKSSKLVRIR
jgi:hypothetical protein